RPFHVTAWIPWCPGWAEAGRAHCARESVGPREEGGALGEGHVQRAPNPTSEGHVVRAPGMPSLQATVNRDDDRFLGRIVRVDGELRGDHPLARLPRVLHLDVVFL